ncbi:hypothetical protein SAMN05216570_2788 [Dyella sp. OK004]|uniref:hypothetical protein n=1 Tax=Dyella sp. OK004 TaxID=1855292 RepID=UPI0008EA0A61|nr:hypothetical protein [Dyella sp. OK004]SFS13109.1 hypothetical protein SAMN05216570_2788 [Dyella sp. OK004]
MNNMTIAGFFGLPLLLVGHHAFALPTPSSLNINAIVKAVMDDQYGSQYDTKHACWTFAHTTEQRDATTYCMRPSAPEVIDSTKGKQLYFYAANAYDIRDDGHYAYSQNDPGLMGAFKIQLDAKGGWTYLALDNAMDFGTAGYCGCNKASFVKLSNQGDYGWLFVSGGIWQGTVVADYSIVMAHKTGFADISKIPQTKAAMQDVRYEVTIASDYPGSGLFPLDVVKIKGSTRLEAFQVSFDSKKFAYLLPSGR